MSVTDSPLRICLLTYRGDPHCGGQGVYVRHLSHALCELGHQVDVVSGPPYPVLDNGARLRRLPSLDLYNPQALFRTPSPRELTDPINLIEWLGVSSMGFPEPLTFGLRALKLLGACGAYDVVHDNQSLSFGVRALSRRVPLVATIHHPITVDRRLAIRAEKRFIHKAKQWRWYSFIGMQKRVAPALGRIITVSARGREDICREFNIPAAAVSVVPNGIDTRRFYPLPDIRRVPHRLITTTSSDTPLKGLAYLLRAMASLTGSHPRLHLVVVGSLKPRSPIPGLIADLGLTRKVRFTGRIDQEAFLRHYAEAWAAVVPSVYEGFGLPAGEAMACGVPVISTRGGALPEVVGDAGLLVPPADPDALALAIAALCDHPELAGRLGTAGYVRVTSRFTWNQAARQTVAVYRQAIDDYRGIKAARPPRP